jgi:hypothetical protein
MHYTLCISDFSVADFRELAAAPGDRTSIVALVYRCNDDRIWREALRAQSQGTSLSDDAGDTYASMPQRSA